MVRFAERPVSFDDRLLRALERIRWAIKSGVTEFERLAIISESVAVVKDEGKRKHAGCNPLFYILFFIRRAGQCPVGDVHIVIDINDIQHFIDTRARGVKAQVAGKPGDIRFYS